MTQNQETGAPGPAEGPPAAGGAGGGSEAPGKKSPEDRGGRTLGQKAKLAAAAVVAAVALLLVLQNQEPTQTRFIVWSVEMPRFALLAFVYLLGTATGWFLRRRRG